MITKKLKKGVVLWFLVVLAIVILKPSLSVSSDRIEVMGFYLGMTINDAVININKLGISYKVMSTGISFGKDMGDWLQQNNNNKINYMLLTYKLFDAQDLSLDAFVQKFASSYHLSPMKFDSMRNSYVYRTSNAEVLIPSDPMGIIIIQEIPKPEFNING